METVAAVWMMADEKTPEARYPERLLRQKVGLKIPGGTDAFNSAPSSCVCVKVGGVFHIRAALGGVSFFSSGDEIT